MLRYRPTVQCILKNAEGLVGTSALKYETRLLSHACLGCSASEVCGVFAQDGLSVMHWTKHSFVGVIYSTFPAVAAFLDS